MASVIIRSHVGKDGILHLTVPESMCERDITVVLKVEPRVPAGEPERDDKGWPVGFFERFAGCCPDLERPEQPPLDPVEPIE